MTAKITMLTMMTRRAGKKARLAKGVSAALTQSAGKGHCIRRVLDFRDTTGYVRFLFLFSFFSFSFFFEAASLIADLSQTSVAMISVCFAARGSSTCSNT